MSRIGGPLYGEKDENINEGAIMNEVESVNEEDGQPAAKCEFADVTGLVEGNKDWSHATRLVEQTNVHGHSLALQPTIASTFLHPPHIPMHDSRDLETEVIRSF